MSLRVSLDRASTYTSHRGSTIFPAIQILKDDLKGQLSQIFEGPELREHRVCYPYIFTPQPRLRFDVV